MMNDDMRAFFEEDGAYGPKGAPTAEQGDGKRRAAFSLPEIMVSVAVIGILAGIAIPILSGVQKGARAETARAIVAQMNRAVMAYGQSEVAISGSGPEWAKTTIPPLEDKADDEKKVMTLLTERQEGVVGSPFLQKPGMPAEESPNTQDFRARWNGAYFEVVPPGAEGTGLRIRL